jgi:uncharacterized protein (DUF697 family)
MRQIFALATGVIAGIATFVCALLLAVVLMSGAENAQDTGPGMAVAFLMIFSVVPLLLTTVIALCVSIASRGRLRLLGPVIGGALAATAAACFTHELGYGALLGLPAIIAGLLAGSVAGWLAIVLAAPKLRQTRRP